MFQHRGLLVSPFRLWGYVMGFVEQLTSAELLSYQLPNRSTWTLQNNWKAELSSRSKAGRANHRNKIHSSWFAQTESTWQNLLGSRSRLVDEERETWGHIVGWKLVHKWEGWTVHLTLVRIKLIYLILWGLWGTPGRRHCLCQLILPRK